MKIQALARCPLCFGTGLNGLNGLDEWLPCICREVGQVDPDTGHTMVDASVAAEWRADLRAKVSDDPGGEW